MRTAFALLGLAIVAGCASEPAPPQQVASAATPAAKPNQTCHKEAPMGSYRPQTVCYDADGDQIDPNDPNKQRAIDDAARQMGAMQRQMGRAGVGR
ncbi:MAG TPA: hypothetical protein VF453_14640 [Burkholderiaceae bacterium]